MDHCRRFREVGIAIHAAGLIIKVHYVVTQGHGGFGNNCEILVVHEKKYCSLSLDPTHWGSSNEGLQYLIFMENNVKLSQYFHHENQLQISLQIRCFIPWYSTIPDTFDVSFLMPAFICCIDRLMSARIYSCNLLYNCSFLIGETLFFTSNNDSFDWHGGGAE